MVVTFKYLRLLFIISPVFIFHPPSFLTLPLVPPFLASRSTRRQLSRSSMKNITFSLSLFLARDFIFDIEQRSVYSCKFIEKKKKGLFISIINDGVARTTNNGPGNNYTRVFVKSVVFVDERDFVHQGRCEFVSSLYFYRFVWKIPVKKGRKNQFERCFVEELRMERNMFTREVINAHKGWKIDHHT